MHLAELEEQSVLDMLEADQTNKDLLPQYGRDGKLNIFDDRVRVAVLDAILQAGIGFDGHGISGLSKTIFDDLLAASTAIKNKKAAKAVRRLATLHVQEVSFIASVGSFRCTFIASVSNLNRFFIAVVERQDPEGVLHGLCCRLLSLSPWRPILLRQQEDCAPASALCQARKRGESLARRGSNASPGKLHCICRHCIFVTLFLYFSSPLFQFAIGRSRRRVSLRSLVHPKQMNLRLRQQQLTDHPR